MPFEEGLLRAMPRPLLSSTAGPRPAQQRRRALAGLCACLCAGALASCGSPAAEETPRAFSRAQVDDDAASEPDSLGQQQAAGARLAEGREFVPTSAAVNANPCERIISLAVAEEGRGPDEVGQELTTYPYKLGNYLQPDEAWCSEFVSWIYRVAERPFTEGDEGGWMLKGSVEIRSWFAARQAFVSTTDAAWPSFAPQPGDYIRYNTDSGGHSGIVREVAGDTLYTVEGNVGNKVILRTIPDWRSYSPIDGIGRLGLTCGCSQDSECDDQNACTQDRCVEKSCQSTPITGCCTQDSQCDDQNSSTTDRCAEHACVHETAVGENTSGSSSAADDGSADDGSSVAEPSPRPQLEAPLAPTSPGNLVGGCSLSGQRHAHADLLFPLLAVLALARHRARRRPTR